MKTPQAKLKKNKYEDEQYNVKNDSMRYFTAFDALIQEEYYHII